MSATSANQHYDYAIVGMGIGGLTLAALLASVIERPRINANGCSRKRRSRCATTPRVAQRSRRRATCDVFKRALEWQKGREQ